jgi:hypothetical protein
MRKTRQAFARGKSGKKRDSHPDRRLWVEIEDVVVSTPDCLSETRP